MNLVILYVDNQDESNRVHSRLGYFFWDKGIKDFVALDLDVYYNLLSFNQ